MPLPLPSLDTRRWSDLVDEARAMIPRYAPNWTDHNIHDPGITLVELLAWLVEMDIYQLNRVPAAHKRKFLALVGVRPLGAQAARALLSVTPERPASMPADATLDAVDLLAGAQFVATSSEKKAYRFRSTEALHAVRTSIATALVQQNAALPPRDALKGWIESGTVAPFGLEPQAGAAFWLGFDHPLPEMEPVQFAITLAGGRSGPDERRRIAAEAEAQAALCRPTFNKMCDDSEAELAPASAASAVLLHHSVRLVWEFYTAAGWRILDPDAGEVWDDTRALTLDGLVRVTLPEAMARLDGGNGRLLYYLRARVAAGEYDTPPILRRTIINGLPVEQAIPASAAYLIQPGVVEIGTPTDHPRFAFDDGIAITALDFTTDAPQVPIRYFRPATAAEPGVLIAEMVAIGRSDGTPDQRMALRLPSVQADSLHVFSDDPLGGWQAWASVPDFDAAGGTDAVFALDGASVVFGDGDHGRIPPDGAVIFARCNATAAASGNLRGGQINTLAPSLANWILFDLADFEAVVTDVAALLTADFDALWKALSPASYAAAAARLGVIANLDAAEGGMPAETLTHATGRAVSLLQAPTRAITAADYNALALATPGTAIARTHGLAGQHPAYPCLAAPGIVTVIVVPDAKGIRPLPSAGLIGVVRRFLNRRRIVGTYIEVVAPSYVTVQINAQVKTLPGAARSRVQADVIAALNAFLNPLTGGAAAIAASARSRTLKPSASASAAATPGLTALAPPPAVAPALRPAPPPEPGCPFGRDVYRSEILQVIDGVAGVDNVLALELIGDGAASDCGNLCVGAAQLVVPGEHSIEVVT